MKCAVLIVEDDPEQRKTIKRAVEAVNKKLTEHALETAVCDCDFVYKDVENWVEERFGEYVSCPRVALLLDLLWIPEDERETEKHNQKKDEYTDLLLCPGHVAIRLKHEGLPPGLKLLKHYVERMLRGMSIAVISKFGSDSMENLAFHLGADFVVQKRPDLPTFLGVPANTPLPVMEAAFDRDLRTAVLEMREEIFSRRKLVEYGERGGLTDFKTNWQELRRLVSAPTEKSEKTLAKKLKRLEDLREHRRERDGVKIHDLDIDSLETNLYAYFERLLSFPWYDHKYYYLEQALNVHGRDPAFFAKGARMTQIMANLEPLVAIDDVLLLLGPTGAGKNFIAKWIHANSLRAEGEFVEMDCANIATDLFASELFGHEKGAFTGAIERRIGLLEVAAVGTVFLDEFGKGATPDFMTKFVHFLGEGGSFRRVGGNKDIPRKARVLIGTSLCESEIRRLSEDLWYRISKFRVDVPPLADYPDDIPELAEHLLANLQRGKGLRISDSVMAFFKQYRWPGNIRELKNALDYGATWATYARQSVIQNKHLPPYLRPLADGKDTAGIASTDDSARATPVENDTVEESAPNLASATEDEDRVAELKADFEKGLLRVKARDGATLKQILPLLLEHQGNLCRTAVLAGDRKDRLREVLYRARLRDWLEKLRNRDYRRACWLWQEELARPTGAK